MRRGGATIALVCLVACTSPAAAGAPGGMVNAIPPHDAADADAPVVTRENVLASERFWPYLVALAREVQVDGRSLTAGSSGVLIRVESTGRARIDFGRDGLATVDVGDTDLVARGNRIREGSLEKLAPNFVLAIGPRLLDPSRDDLRALGFERAAESRLFLCVFADPTGRSFGAVADRIARLPRADGLSIVLFPLGTHGDAAVAKALKKRRWPGPFVYDHLSEPYVRSLTDADTRPAVLLQTAEGRILVDAGGVADTLPRIEAELTRERAMRQARR
jgi:hypothetical protein